MLQRVAAQLAETRQEQGLSMEALALQAGITLEELQAVESGDVSVMYTWPVEKIKRLADGLHISFSRLLGETILDYDEWALIWSALIEYSAHQPGLTMKTDMKALIQKVRSFIPTHQIQELDG
jgi:transcriptional regulator with XRE-family HTH domain